MIIVYLGIFVGLVLFSAFFSAAETSFLSIDRVHLRVKAARKDKKAMLLNNLLSRPDEFLSTLLIGNNFVNIASASISTLFFTQLLPGKEKTAVIVATLATTLIILLFGEIIPKTYAFRYSERLAYLYTVPIKAISYLFYPLVKGFAYLTAFIFRESKFHTTMRDLSPEEIKIFLSSEIGLFHHNPEVMRMMHDIVDITDKDIKGVMTPRVNIIALEESAGIEDLKKLVLERQVSKIPIYRGNLDNIVGIVHTKSIMEALITGNLDDLDLIKLSSKPIFISEYSSLHFSLKEFKKKELNIAVVLDEYGAVIGILTLYDIFREILGGIPLDASPIRKIDKNVYVIKGNMPVEAINSQLNLDLPVKKDYTTLSGLFVYHYGRFPIEQCRIQVKDYRLIVRRLGKRKIDEITLVLKDHGPKE